ncbi:MAG TPA: PP2C family serine/threonine-protein phosphatase [Pyrinomonadaceae bacterium]|nr:PP2C family serine/threonine-protein phosphatase [Pyrinomonadaceae bacterium]
MNDWRFAYASVTGSAHQNQSTECQDRFLCESVATPSGDVLIAVVADGAGSTTAGQHGAEAACSLFRDTVVDFLNTKNASVRSLNLEFGKLWVGFLRNRIAGLASESGKEIREYASTVIGTVVGDDVAAFFQVGDGGAVYSLTGEVESFEFAIPPQDSEYVNVTEFVTDDFAEGAVRFALIDARIEDVVLFSDGIYAVAVDYQSNRPHEPFLKPMIAPLRNPNGTPERLNEKLEAFLSSPKLNEKTDDDKTIILASRAQ